MEIIPIGEKAGNYGRFLKADLNFLPTSLSRNWICQEMTCSLQSDGWQGKEKYFVESRTMNFFSAINIFKVIFVLDNL